MRTTVDAPTTSILWMIQRVPTPSRAQAIALQEVEHVRDGPGRPSPRTPPGEHSTRSAALRDLLRLSSRYTLATERLTELTRRSAGGCIVACCRNIDVRAATYTS